MRVACRRSFILAIDQGTSSSRAVIYAVDEHARLRVVAQGSQAFKQYYPQPGWVEHDLNEIWQSVVVSVAAALDTARQSASFDPKQIAGIGITNQRESLCLWQAQSSAPVLRSIVWQCKRSESVCAEWQERGYASWVKARTGLCLDPYFSASKLAWLLKEQPQLAGELKQGQILVGTIDTYLIHRLTQGQVYATEPSNASRTMLYRLDGTWDPELAQRLGCPQHIYASMQDSCGEFGLTDIAGLLPEPRPISGVLGDQQAAALGQQCLQPGQLKCTYGTGAFLMVQAGEQPLISTQGLLSTVGWQVGGRKNYMLEGSTFIAGAGIAYLKDIWGFLKTPAAASQVQAVASPEVMFVPELAGLGAPYWQPRVRGTLLGLSAGTSRDQIIRALLEGVVFRVMDMVEAASRDLQVPPQSLQVDGGMARNDPAMQFQADMLGIQVSRSDEVEATALGVAIMAAYGCGALPSLQLPSAAGTCRSENIFMPHIQDHERRQHRAAWQRALQAALVFADVDLKSSVKL